MNERLNSRDSTTPDKCLLIQQFKEVTGNADEAYVSFQLEKCNWDISNAINKHYIESLNYDNTNSLMEDMGNLDESESTIKSEDDNMNNEQSTDDEDKAITDHNNFFMNLLLIPLEILKSVASTAFNIIVKILGLNINQVGVRLTDSAICSQHRCDFNHQKSYCSNFSEYLNERIYSNHQPKMAFSEKNLYEVLDEVTDTGKVLLAFFHNEKCSGCVKYLREIVTSSILIEKFSNFIVWGCSFDDTLDEHQFASQTFKIVKIPTIIILAHVESANKIIGKIRGISNVDDVNHRIEIISSRFKSLISIYRQTRLTIKYNRELREMQDAKYAESLRIDQEKLKKSQILKDEQLKAEEQKNQIMLDKIKLEEQYKQCRNKIKNEFKLSEFFPGSIMIYVRLPNGKKIKNYFEKNASITELYNFVISNDQCPKFFNLFIHNPKRIINFPVDLYMTQHKLSTFSDSQISETVTMYLNEVYEEETD
ncbi:FAS-associated factor 2-B [Intoshia linei]|uniref:FAS-associated factor 2-B n=1 Tax=Intoshia linei TaxID=1819745 RepID=A0A177B025_9BILA|nr:FAS-associated factor 2-B [Intoshia linei]